MVYSEVERYINENRVFSLQSKIGKISKDNFETAVDKFFNDVLEEFQSDNKELYENYPRK